MKNLLRNKRALSPVIATVILVSVTIVVAVSVAYWMGTIASSYTSFEQIELPSSYSEYTTDLNASDGIPVDPGWKVHVDLKNTGSADATIDNVFLNAKPLKDYTASTVRLFVSNDTTGANEVDLSNISVPILKGASEKLILWIQADSVEGCTHGTTINLKFHSAAGLDYPANVRLI